MVYEFFFWKRRKTHEPRLLSLIYNVKHSSLICRLSPFHLSKYSVDFNTRREQEGRGLNTHEPCFNILAIGARAQKRLDFHSFQKYDSSMVLVNWTHHQTASSTSNIFSPLLIRCNQTLISTQFKFLTSQVAKHPFFSMTQWSDCRDEDHSCLCYFRPSIAFFAPR